MAFITFGSGSMTAYPAGNGVTSYPDWAKETGPRLKRRGITRVKMHNPGGSWPQPLTGGGDGREMRVDQWILAERARLPFSSRFDFRTAVGILEEHGVTEVCCYVGSPTQLLDPINELPQVLEAFTDCGPIVSIGFDAMFEDGLVANGLGKSWQELWAPGSDYRAAIATLRKKHKVYTEARVHPGQLAAGLAKLVDGSFAEAQFDARFKYDLTKQPGESFRTTLTGNQTGQWPEIDAWPANVTPVLRSELNWGPIMDRA
jgi:hypothetical protein